MTWFTGCVVYVVIWWTALFAVLPFGTKSQQSADNVSGWRGAPENPRILSKVIATTIVAAVLWIGVWFLVQSDTISFRHGLFAAPDE
jgi:predicted secreted protein